MNRSAILLILFGIVNFSNAASDGLQFVATPSEIIPGLTQGYHVSCDPGNTAYRAIFFIQLLSRGSGGQVPIATLLPGQAPTLAVTDPRVTASGQLAAGAGSGAAGTTPSLTLHVDRPTPLDAGSIICKINGLTKDGNAFTLSKVVSVTIHPESEQVSSLLKEMAAQLTREADALQAQTQALKAENARMRQLGETKKQALAQKRADLDQLRAEMQSLQKVVEAKEDSLNQTAARLAEEIANVTQHAPPMRVAFNAAQNTERIYAAGKKVEFETVAMNDGDGYNASVGEFRAPVAGVYLFTLNLLAHDTASAGYRTYSIRVNSTVVGSAYSRDDRQSSGFAHSGTSTIVDLTPYDTVSVYAQVASTSTTELVPYSNTPDGHSTSFAGYLLY